MDVIFALMLAITLAVVAGLCLYWRFQGRLASEQKARRRVERERDWIIAQCTEAGHCPPDEIAHGMECKDGDGAYAEDCLRCWHDTARAAVEEGDDDNPKEMNE